MKDAINQIEQKRQLIKSALADRVMTVYDVARHMGRSYQTARRLVNLLHLTHPKQAYIDHWEFVSRGKQPAYVACYRLGSRVDAPKPRPDKPRKKKEIKRDWLIAAFFGER